MITADVHLGYRVVDLDGYEYYVSKAEYERMHEPWKSARPRVMNRAWRRAQRKVKP